MYSKPHSVLPPGTSKMSTGTTLLPLVEFGEGEVAPGGEGTDPGALS